MAALTNSLHEQRVPIEADLIWSETILFKFLLHSSFFLNLFKDTGMLYRDKVIELFDEPTMVVMLRVILENYLTFFYLYCDNIKDDEKQFRMDVWKYSGVKQKSELEVFGEEKKDVQEKNLQEIAELKTRIEESPFFLAYKKDIQKEILKGVKPRLIYGWQTLIKMSGLNNDLFKKIYSYQSAYAHTEFHSIFQMRERTKFRIPNPKLHSFLIIAHFIVCKCIFELKELFPSIKIVFESMDNQLIREIEFIYLVAITKVQNGQDYDTYGN